MNKLSYSSLNRFMKCSESYRLHYIERLRPTVTSANLLLGSALDEALNVLLSGNCQQVYKSFDNSWAFQLINKVRTDIRFDTKVVYAAKDLDLAILTSEDRALLKDINVDEVLTRYKQRAHIEFTEAEHRNYSYIHWVCLRRKGYLIIDAYTKEVLPRIKRVVAIQKPISFDNGSGDSITGVIDLIAELDDGKVYVLDNKSSSRMYEADSARMSPQLALYGRHEGINDIGFIVFSKNIRKDKHKVCSQCGFERIDGARHVTCSNEVSGKRCGGAWDETVTCKADIQIILDTTNKNMAVATMDNFKAVNKLINEGVFFKNTHACGDWYGSDCCYKNLCHYNRLAKLEKV